MCHVVVIFIKIINLILSFSLTYHYKWFESIDKWDIISVIKTFLNFKQRTNKNGKENEVIHNSCFSTRQKK